MDCLLKILKHAMCAARRTKLLPVFFLAAGISAADAEITLPRIFSDSMVLQRDQNNRIWGLSTGKRITIKIADYYRSCDVENGRWETVLPALEASNEPTEILIMEDGKLAGKISDVLVGEVWIAGGEADMAFPLKREKSFGAEKDASLQNPIRIFKQPKKDASAIMRFNSDPSARWINSSRENMGEFSAVAYLFAKDISTKLGVAVGIVEADDEAGSGMICWLAQDDAKKARPYREHMESIAGKKLPDIQMPGYLYNAKIAPISGYGARGFIWYQGGSDTADTMGEAFRLKFERLVNSWRKYWHNEGMPFLFVQLPSSGSKQNWADAREQQRRAENNLDEAYMACAIDTGEESKTASKDNSSIAHRLALIAFDQVYGIDGIVSYSPTFDSMMYNGTKAEIFIDYRTSSLKVAEPLRGFEILAGGKWKAAKAKVMSENSIEVENDSDERIDGVRYLWKSWAKPDACVFDSTSLPMKPFIHYRR